MNFKEWLLNKDKALFENMWGNIPCKTRKPSDGWGSRGTGQQMQQGQQEQQPSGPQMMKKMKRKMKK